MQSATLPFPNLAKKGELLARPDLVYLIFCALVFSVPIGFYVVDPFGFETPHRDTWHHLAVLRELIAHPFNPSNPHIPTEEPSRYFTPLNILTALLARFFGVSPFWAFNYMAAVNCIAFCAVCWLFAKRSYQSEYAPIVFLAVMLFGWGIQRGHVGFHNFATFLSSAGYPATQALILGILSWYICLTALKDQGKIRRNAALLAIVCAITIVTHQFGGFVMLVGTGCFALFHRTAEAKSKMIIVGSLLLGGLLSLSWPYFNPLAVVISASDPRWITPAPDLQTIIFPFMLLVPSLIGLAGLRDKTGGIRWEILVPLLFFVVSFLVLHAAEASIAHRFTPAIILYLQLATVWTLLEFDYGKTNEKTKPLIGLLVCGFIVAGLVKAFDPRIDEFTVREEFGRLMTFANAMESDLPPGSVTFATEAIVYPLQSSGRRVVSIPRPEPVAPSLIERQQATDLFFAKNTTKAERRALIERWGATHAAFAVADLDPQVVADLKLLGPSKSYHRNGEIVSVSIRGAQQ
ncbi:MAG: hypothetical protein AAGB23_04845 [Pseudomonadota bacterium]